MATMSTATKLITGEELLRMPNSKYFELVRGELIELSPPGGEHGNRASKIDRLLGNFVDRHELGTLVVESGFYVERNPDTVRGPDVSFFSKDRLDPDEEVEGYYEIPPDLAIEIVSPGDRDSEVAEKAEEYLRAGVRAVWVIDPRRRKVTVYPEGKTLTGEDTLTGGDVLPGFAIPVLRLFRSKKR